MVDPRAELILSLIRTGREKAITAREITGLTGIREREIQYVVEGLRTAGHPIASAVQPPFGYYIPRDEMEAVEYENHMAARIKSQCIALNCVRRAFERPPVGLQEQLDLLGEATSMVDL